MRRTQLATLCYLQHRGKTLMLLRNKKKNDVHKGKWNGLGGKFLDGESPEECVMREVEEESGFRIGHPHLRGILTFPLFTPNTDWSVYLFTADRFTGSLRQSHEGMLEWIPNSKIRSLNLWKGDRYFLKWLGQSRFFSAKFIYRNKKYQSHQVHFYP